MTPNEAPLRSVIKRPAAVVGAIQSGFVCSALTLAAVFSVPKISLADEGGVSYWLPGLFGSLAAAPQQPGWAAASIYYHTSVSAGGDVFLSKEFAIRNVPANLSAHVTANVNATGDLGIFAPSYVFATPFLGGQASATVMAIYGNIGTALSGTVTGTAGGIPFGPRFDSIGDSTTGFGDLYPQSVGTAASTIT